jgi:hypothetical protein
MKIPQKIQTICLPSKSKPQVTHNNQYKRRASGQSILSSHCSSLEISIGDYHPFFLIDQIICVVVGGSHWHSLSSNCPMTTATIVAVVIGQLLSMSDNGI